MTSTIQNILISILKSPQPQIITELARMIITEEGKSDFIENLRSNNSLAFIYLKQYMTENIQNGTHIEYASGDFLLFLVSVTQKNNLGYMLGYIEKLSLTIVVPEEFVASMISHQRFDVLDAVFRKYTVKQRSDALYLEIIRNIELMTPTFDRIYRGEGQRPDEFYSEHLLSMLYSLVYQDIHPYFEDNYTEFFGVFSLLFNHERTKDLVIKIYDIFILKYPDCTDFGNIILSLCKMKSFDYQAVNTLTHAYSYKRIHDDEIVKMLGRVLVFDIGDVDVQVHTNEMVKGVDTVRGASHKLIRLLNPNVYLFSNEVLIFVATVLKYKDAQVTDVCKRIVNTKSQDSAAFSAFLYLIKMQEFGPCSWEYLNTPIKPMCMKYYCEIYKSYDHYHLNELHTVMNMEHSPISVTQVLGDSTNLCSSILLSLNTEIDEITSELLFRMAKAEPGHLTTDLYTSLTDLFKKMNVISTASLQYLFDVYVLLSLKFKKFNQGLIEKILADEILECYAYCFYYLAIMLDSGMADSNEIRNLSLQILQQDKLWSEKSVQFSMVCLTVAAYNRGLVTPQQIQLISATLREYGKIVLLHKCHAHSKDVADPVGNFLVNDVLDREWLAGNYVDKKYVRMTISKLGKLGEHEVLLEVAKRNSRLIEEEVIAMHSVVRYFKL